MPDTIRSLKARGYNPRTILDIGAWTGDTGEIFRSIWPDAKIMCIDGNPRVESFLEKQAIKHNFDYKIAVLSDVPGKTVDFWVGEMGNGNSYYKQKISGGNWHSLRLTTESLDHLFNKNDQFDFIKIDTQGSELDILRGGVNLISHAHFIICEVSIQEYNIGGCTVDEMYKFMLDNHYSLEDIEEFKHDGIKPLCQTDFLFRRKG